MKYLLVGLVALVLSLFTVTATAAGPMAGGELHSVEYTYDFAVDGGATGAIDLSKKYALPVGAVVEDLHYMVKTALTSSGSATVAIGDSDTANRYLAATAYDNAAFDANVPKVGASGLPLYVSAAAKGKPSITIADAALTAGKIKIWMKLYVPKN